MWFAECQKNTRQRWGLPIVFFYTRQSKKYFFLGKKEKKKNDGCPRGVFFFAVCLCFAECFFLVCRVVFFQHSTKSLVCRVLLFCRVWFLQHSTNDFFIEYPMKYTRWIFWRSTNHLFSVVVQGCKEKTSYVAQAITGKARASKRYDSKSAKRQSTSAEEWDSNRFSCRTIKVAQNKWALVWLDKHVPRPCLVPPISWIWHYAKRRFSITSNLRYMHGVLNVDEIKN